MLKIPLNLGLDASYERDRFSEILLEKGLEFVLSRRNSIIVFNLSFILLLVKINPVLEKQSCKNDAFVVRTFGRVKIILTLLIKVIVLYMRVSMIKVGVLHLEEAIARYNSCLKLAMFLAFNKQF